MSKHRKLAIDVLHGLVEYLLLFPILLLVGSYLVSKESIFLWLLTILGIYLLGIVVKTILPMNWSIYPLLALLIGLVPSYLFAEHLLFLLVLIILHSIVVYRGMLYASREWSSLLPISYIWLMAFIIYFVCFFIFKFIDRLIIYENIVSICGIVAVILSLLITNSETLKASSLSKQDKPFISGGVKRHNRLLLIITVIIAILFTNGAIIRETVWNVIRAFLRWIFGQSSGDEEMQPVETPPPNPLNPGLPKPNEQSAILKLLETIMIYFVYVCLAVLLVFVLLLMIKRGRLWLKKVIGKFIAFLKQIGNPAHLQDESAYYTDEKESVFDWKEWKDAQQAKVANLVGNMFKREREWNSLSNQEKVRYIYRTFLENQQNKLAFHPANTPRETLRELTLILPEDKKRIELLKDAYEKTRYGEKEINQKTMDEIYELIKSGR